MEQPMNQNQRQQQARMYWYAGWFDVALGMAALLWLDTLMPYSAPIVAGLSIGTITGLVLLLLAAPGSFFLYYYIRPKVEDTPASRGPVEKL
jgi:hypothetical protein